jgi:hypothetical protein
MNLAAYGSYRAPADLWRVAKAGHCGASAVAKHEFYERVNNWFALHTTSNISAFN